MQNASMFAALFRSIAQYVCLDKFLSDDAAPLAASAACEPGPGVRIKAIDTRNNLSVDRNILTSTTSPTAYLTDPLVYYQTQSGSAFDRVAGRVIYIGFTYRTTTGSSGLQFNAMNSLSPTSSNLFGIGFTSATLNNCNFIAVATPTTIAINTAYVFAVVLGTYGQSVFIRGGAFSSWTFVCSSRFNADATIYPSLSNFNNVDISFVSIKDIGPVELACISWTNAATASVGECAADAWHQVHLTAPSGSSGNKFELRFRRVDANNYLFVRLIWASSTIYNLEAGHVIDGVETQYGAAATSVMASSHTRSGFVVRAEGSALKIWSARNTTVGLVERFAGTTDTNFQTATGVEVVTVGTWATSLVESFSLQSSKTAILGSASVENVLTMGDSKTANYQWQGYLAAMALNKTPSRLLRHYPTGFAVGGATVNSRKLTVDSDISGAVGTPNKILINLGINDVSHVPDDGFEAQWKSDYLYIIDALHTAWPNAQIYIAHVWSSISNVTYLATLNTWIDYVLAQRTFCIAGLDERITLENGDNGATMTSDGVHQTVTGDRAIAKAWLSIIS